MAADSTLALEALNRTRAKRASHGRAQRASAPASMSEPLALRANASVRTEKR
ncbi:MAG TPA: hypothetical protein VH436_23115 [Vicinamibacterales bacterium]|jgi:hypothetical protein